jgi:stalled ribosome rescue protein Dom34
MSDHYHAIVWIDHHEARVFHFNAAEVDRLVLRPHDPTVHIHHKAHTIGSGHAAEDQNFFRDVESAIAQAGAVLITGPANAKTALMTHMREHAPQVAKAVVGVETVDHPTDRELVAHARTYFKADDRLHPQR